MYAFPSHCFPRPWAHVGFASLFAGCTLLFYETYGKNSLDQSGAPRCALFAEDSIVQSIPEHPKKENVFCLSNSFGDVYLFQVPPSFLWWAPEHRSCTESVRTRRRSSSAMKQSQS